MLNSDALEVAIGMAFLFLAVSLVCSAVQEALEGVFKWRAMDLERALRTLLGDPDGSITSQLLAHPMLDGLFPGQYDPTRLRRSLLAPGRATRHMPLLARRQLPSYIPADQFAVALLDSIARGPAAPRAPGMETAFEDLAGAPLDVATLRSAALQLPSGPVQRAVLAALDHADGDLAIARRNVERWFDGVMERASGWYKRRTQLMLFLLGLAVAVGLNVDALNVMSSLLADKALRAVVVQQAAAAQLPEAAASGAPLATQLDRISTARAVLDAVALPIGWRMSSASAPGVAARRAGHPVPRQVCGHADRPCEGPGAIDDGWVLVVCGWLLTAFAITLGAPFWFDLLGKFMMVRASLKPPTRKSGAPES